MAGPLDGIRVLDLTSVVLGPYATMLLGDLGADVVKLEPPEGDSMRFAGHQGHPGMGSISLTLGRNKRSVVVDLKAPGATEVLHALVRRADVVVHNIRPEPARRLGLDYEQLSLVNPAIVHATALGFGAGGPYSGQPAYDDLVQGLSGAVGLMERQAGEPRYVPMIVVDKTTGLALAAVVLAALLHRERTGEGQAVTVPMFETMASFVLVEHLADSTYDPPVGPPGYARVLSPFRKPYRTADGHICALPYLDKHFAALFEVVDRPELASDARFATLGARVANIDAVYEAVDGMLADRTTAEWLEVMRAAGIPCAPVNQLQDLFADPHLEAVGFWEQIDHPTEGPLRQPRLPWGFGANEPVASRPAPALGAQTDEVLREAGLSDARLAALRAEGVIAGG